MHPRVRVTSTLRCVTLFSFRWANPHGRENNNNTPFLFWCDFIETDRRKPRCWFIIDYWSPGGELFDRHAHVSSHQAIDAKVAEPVAVSPGAPDGRRRHSDSSNNGCQPQSHRVHLPRLKKGYPSRRGEEYSRQPGAAVSPPRP